MTRKLIVSTAGLIAVMALFLLVPAGRLDWPAAWGFLAEMGVLSLAVGLWLARHDPALLAERLGSPFQRTQKTWDKIFMAVVMVLYFGWLVLMGLDARWGISRMPIGCKRSARSPSRSRTTWSSWHSARTATRRPW